MTALLRGYLWKGEKGRSGDLDSRWGDTSISAPTLGGWNQLSSEAPVGRSEPEYRSDNGKEPNRLNSTKSIRPRITRHQSNPSSKKDTKASDSDKPVFVYKPASDAFLRDMAALGNPRPDPENIPSEYDYSNISYNPRLILYKDEGDDLVKELSESTGGSTALEHPQELRNMPHHPSYKSSISSQSASLRSRSSVRSTSSRPRRNAITPVSPTRSLSASPKLSPRPEFSPVDYGEPSFRKESSSTLSQISLRGVDQPFNRPAGKKADGHKRKVTEVMVPSSAELFG